MAENVSSNVLFHFTDSMRHLFSIFEHGFFPHYCPEYTLRKSDLKAASKNKPPEFAIPQVSFCDLPLSLIKSHLGKYGKYGIGLGKDWGLRHGLSPVIYTHSKAQNRQAIGHLADRVPQNAESTLLATYTRPYEGFEWRKGVTNNNRVCFYDEREWRYVPPLQKGDSLALPQNDYLNRKKVAALEKTFKNKYALKIEPDDIQYLIVPTDRQVIRLAEFLKRLYAGNDGVLITTAIMTANRIDEDV